MVLGKCIAKRHVRISQKQCPGNAASALSWDTKMSTPKPPNKSQQPPPPPPRSPMLDFFFPDFTLTLAPIPTPTTQTSTAPTPWTPMSVVLLMLADFAMDTTLLMTLSTPAPDVSTPIIQYGFGHYSESPMALPAVKLCCVETAPWSGGSAHCGETACCSLVGDIEHYLLR